MGIVSEYGSNLWVVLKQAMETNGKEPPEAPTHPATGTTTEEGFSPFASFVDLSEAAASALAEQEAANTASLKPLVAMDTVMAVQDIGAQKISAIPGAASLNSTEIANLRDKYHNDTEVKKALDSFVISRAQKIIDKNDTPSTVKNIYTSGNALDGKGKANTGKVATEADKTYQLALSYTVTGNSDYLEMGKKYILAWADKNKPNGDAVANTNLENIFRSYDLLKNHFSEEERGEVEGWMNRIVSAIKAKEADTEINPDRAPGLSSRLNNHHSHALKTIGMVALITNNTDDIEYVKSEFSKQVARSFANEDGSGIDFEARDSVRYHAYSLQELLKVGQMLQKSGAIDYNPYTKVMENGASLERAMEFLAPYSITGEGAKTHKEYVDSQNIRDGQNRDAARNGTPRYDPKYSLDSLSYAAYFSESITGRIDISELAGDITNKSGNYATLELLLNTV